MCLRVESRDVAGRAELDLSRGKADDTHTHRPAGVSLAATTSNSLRGRSNSRPCYCSHPRENGGLNPMFVFFK